MTLDVDGLLVRRGRLAAVHGVSLSVEGGSIVGLTGLNGAGKTSFLLALAGVIESEAGSIGFEGEDVTAMGAAERRDRGIALVPEGRRLFGPLSVEDNLLIGAGRHHSKERGAVLDEIYEVFPLLAERRRQAAFRLSGGQQQQLALARGMMSRPRLLLMDEPTLGLSPKIIDTVFDAIREFQSRHGLTMLIAEQDVGVATEVCSWLHVMENGELSGGGPASEFTAEQMAKQTLTGSGAATPGTPEATPQDQSRGATQ